MAKAPPAFQFYPGDFMTGTSRLTTTEVGGYILLLCEQWQTGSVPGDDEKALALIMRCSRSQARAIWTHISHKFQREDSGVWTNARLEDERNRQDDYRTKMSGRGKTGAGKRWEKDSPRDACAIAQALPNACLGDAKPMPSDSSSSSSSVRTKNQIGVGVVPQKATTTTAPPLVMNSLRYAQALQHHAFIGARLKVPNKLHDDFRRLLGGTDSDGRLVQWYHDVDAEIETSGEPIVPDVFKWLESRFRVWASSTANDAAVRAWVEGV